jgi:hypothetical protein
MAKPIAFDFVLEYLLDAEPVVKPMFGAHAVYVRDKIVFILRDKGGDTDSGVWLATVPEHHASLQAVFPSMRSIEVFGGGTTGWQVLPAEEDDFEATVQKACELVLKGDPRIGKVPPVKNRKKKS